MIVHGGIAIHPIQPIHPGPWRPEAGVKKEKERPLSGAWQLDPCLALPGLASTFPLDCRL